MTASCAAQAQALRWWRLAPALVGPTPARAPARMQARGARRVEERSADNAYSRSARHKATSHIRLLVQPGAQRLRVRAWCSAIDVKQRLRDACGVPVGFIRLMIGGAGWRRSEVAPATLAAAGTPGMPAEAAWAGGVGGVAA